MRAPSLTLAVLALCFHAAGAFLLGIDLGNQFFKAAIVAPGKRFEVVHNQHSKRKTPTAVSFHEKVRTFGDDALSSAARGLTKTPMLFSAQLGRNLSGVTADSYSWLPTDFYPYKLGANETGSLHFQMGDHVLTVEEAMAHVLDFSKQLANEAVESGIRVSESVLTVSPYATFQQRRALLAAADIAAFPPTQLVHETSAAALVRAVDLANTPNQTGLPTTTLMYNMGARHAEACVVKFRAAIFRDKPTVAVDVLGCSMNHELGGHQVDIVIAKHMLAAFQAKHPKLADGVATSVRALKKLEKEANSKKHVLSANKDAQFHIESLYEDTDFMQPVSREQLEQWSTDIFAKISEPVEVALEVAKVAMGDIDTVEMIGGGWRIPRVQVQLLEYIQSKLPEGATPLNLSQHLNGDEASATGACYKGANTSTSFQMQRMFFTDVLPHAYEIKVEPLNATQLNGEQQSWSLGAELFPAWSLLSAQKTVKLHESFDLQVTLLENGNTAMVWSIAGIHASTAGAYAHLDTPLISLKFEIDISGVVQLYSAQAFFDEPVNSSTANTSTSNFSEPVPDNATTATEGSDAAASPEDVSKSDEGNASMPQDGAGLNSSEASPAAPKIKKRKVRLSVVEALQSFTPAPLSREQKIEAAKRLAAMRAADEALQRIDALKNELEGFVYEAREKLGGDEFTQQVSTEEHREELMSLLTATEDWLYEDEAAAANASVFESRLASLRGRVMPVLSRGKELEFRSMLPDLIEKIMTEVNATLEHVRANMTWVDARERDGIMNLSRSFDAWFADVSEQQAALQLTDEPAYNSSDVRRRLQKVQSEAQRLTKIRDMRTGWSGFGGGSGSKGGWWDKFSNFFNYSNWNYSGWGNDSDYMRSYYEYFSKGGNASDANSSAGGGGDAPPRADGDSGAAGAADAAGTSEGSTSAGSGGGSGSDGGSTPPSPPPPAGNESPPAGSAKEDL